MAVCVLALLCQALALPIMAASANESVSAGDSSVVIPDMLDKDQLIGYKDYVQSKPAGAATESFTVNAIDGEDTTPMEQTDAPEAEAPEVENPEVEAPEAENPEAEAPETEAPEGENAEGEDVAVAAEATEEPADEPVDETVDEVPVIMSEEGDALIFNAMGAQVTWNVTVPQTGWYKVSFTYAGVEREGSSSDMELGLMVNGVYPYYEAQRFVLPRTWVDAGPIRESGGNQFAPEQEESFEYNTVALRDVNGFVTDDLCIYLEAGEQTLTITSFGEPIKLKTIHLDIPTTLKSYKDQVAEWEKAGVKKYDGKELVVEAETAKSKTDRTVIGLSDNSNPAVQPADAFHQKVNYIGGANWSMPDEEIVWVIKDVPEAGLYKVGFHYRQNYLVNASAFRSMKINGEHQYAEMANIGFEYKNSWNFMESFANGDPILVYLEKGDNEVSLAVTLGDMSDFSAQMEQLSEDLAKMYRDIVAIISETPDKNTDYDLFQRVPDLEERMKELRSRIADMIASRREGGKDLDDNAAMLQKMDVVLERMLIKQYEAQNYKSNFYDCYASLTAQLQDMKNMALDLDVIVFASPEAEEFERDAASFWEKLWFACKRFVASFMLDYNTSSGNGEEGSTDLTIWVNWSRDQTLVLNSLINSRFAEQYPDINVTVRMTNASLLQGIMSGNGPDCCLSDSRTSPVNLAMRGALVNLQDMEGYDELFYGKDEAYDIYNPDNTKCFAYGADEPYKYGDGVYGLPSTQQFYMMFYRTDIFEQYGLEVPKTWDEFLTVAGILMLNNMQVGLPYVALTDISQTNGGVASLNIFPTLLMQQTDENGKQLSVYNDTKTGTSFNDPDTMRVFEEWTDFYTKYNLPKEYSFFNRFRVGMVPLAIQTYGQYSALSAAAPEIKGKWAMAEIPGYPVLDENGNYTYDENGELIINNSQAGFGSACMILKLAEERGSADAAWKLLKWWMSTDTQYRYALDIESILGVAGRYTSANVNATLRLDWGKGAEDIIAGQWHKVQELAEIPGGYYVSRAIDQAFWNVLSMNENPKDMMRKWGEIADVEITTKIEQYKKDEEDES